MCVVEIDIATTDASGENASSNARDRAMSE
jgi:hypothetical protein